ncbi:hypothetical protein DFH09DRAFT_1089811 [Mycena vulgaris]|nr:hypothetical protein DFH09DRAFT_1089811 [Mycena vulgaris]
MPTFIRPSKIPHGIFLRGTLSALVVRPPMGVLADSSTSLRPPTALDVGWIRKRYGMPRDCMIRLDYGSSSCKPMKGETNDTGRFVRWFERKLISAATQHLELCGVENIETGVETPKKMCETREYESAARRPTETTIPQSYWSAHCHGAIVDPVYIFKQADK